MSIIYLADRDTRSVAAISRRATQGCDFSQEWLAYTKMSEQQLKDIWDEWDGMTQDGELAHCELNRRGLGAYCSV